MPPLHPCTPPEDAPRRCKGCGHRMYKSCFRLCSAQCERRYRQKRFDDAHGGTTTRHTLAVRRLTLWEREAARAHHPDADVLHAARPTKFSQCLEAGLGKRNPCPFVSCRHHTALGVNDDGNVWLSRPLQYDAGDVVESVDPSVLPVTCSLQTGPMTLEAVGQVLGITRERVRQIELKAFAALKQYPLPIVRPDLRTVPAARLVHRNR